MPRKPSLEIILGMPGKGGGPPDDMDDEVESAMSADAAIDAVYQAAKSEDMETFRSSFREAVMAVFDETMAGDMED